MFHLFLFLCICVCLPFCLYSMYVQCLQKLKRELDLGTRVRAFEWSDVGAGLQVMSAARAVRAVKCWAISVSQVLFIYSLKSNKWVIFLVKKFFQELHYYHFHLVIMYGFHFTEKYLKPLENYVVDTTELFLV